MVHQVTCFSDAYLAWENWNLTSFDSKSECMLTFNKALEDLKPDMAAVATYHLKHGETLLAKSHHMIGPTGETNELYTAGRGVALVIHDSSESNAQLSAIAQMSAALIAGNSVILSSDDTSFRQVVEQAYQQSSLPMNLMQFAPLEAYHQLVELDVRSVAYVGSENMERAINRQIAKRSGAIVGLISETDMAAIPVAHDPHLVLRFITERTRTINITAVGGNATLLELGSEAH
ncbi:1-pyrroline-5-carboxylate dehydrogenase [Vibrio ostreicida]|uniref:1-pyrroline-5-carboxylate dehydrogenase n=1 Tax=Vibrio ostreicida TaxID=526588 RepID=UPI003B5944B3